MPENKQCPRCQQEYESTRRYCWVCNFDFTSTPPSEIVAPPSRLASSSPQIQTPHKKKRTMEDYFVFVLLTLFGIPALIVFLLMVTCFGGALGVSLWDTLLNAPKTPTAPLSVQIAARVIPGNDPTEYAVVFDSSHQKDGKRSTLNKPAGEANYESDTEIEPGFAFEVSAVQPDIYSCDPPCTYLVNIFHEKSLLDTKVSPITVNRALKLNHAVQLETGKKYRLHQAVWSTKWAGVYTTGNMRTFLPHGHIFRTIKASDSDAGSIAFKLLGEKRK